MFLRWAVVFVLGTMLAFGFTMLAVTAAVILKFVFLVLLVLFVASLAIGSSHRA